NARGAVEIVIASVGLSLGVLSQAAYTAIALMAVLTSAMTPPLLTAAVRNWRGSPQEQARLKREESLQRNLLIRPGRLLLPLGADTGCLSAANLLHRAWPLEAGVTIVPAEQTRPSSPRGPRRPRDANLERLLDGREVSYRAAGRDAQTALYASELGYSAMGIALHHNGNGNGNGAGHRIPPVALGLLTGGEIPLVAVRCIADHRTASYDRIVVPVAGTRASAGALELALGLAETASTEVVLLHVTDGAEDPAGSIPVLEHAVSTARTRRVPVQVSVRHGPSVTREILDTAAANAGGLLVLGAALRRTRDGFCFSHAVERILAHADSAVAVVVTPERRDG
ncbi:MAG TPA: universal stress protein, partial [Jatrophihabitans sp.]|nr:universal stress protein [Jatrophihabitans sp.]